MGAGAWSGSHPPADVIARSTYRPPVTEPESHEAARDPGDAACRCAMQVGWAQGSELAEQKRFGVKPVRICGSLS